ncbi:N-acyl homoserine lactonase family protein [Thalassotalea fusca]
MKGVAKKFVKQSMVATSTMVAALCFSNPLLAYDKASNALKLYTFDCGTIDVSNMDVFSSSGDYANQSQRLVGSCYLIRHQQGDLLWDTGLSAELVNKEPLVNGVFTLSMNSTLAEQLKTLALTPDDIEYMSISHSHFDHTGQMAQFPAATWLVTEAELTTITKGEDLQPLYQQIKTLPRKTFTGSYDVFGDGSVVILEMPGHTHGHTVLQVNLANTGPVLLSGDLYHQAKSRELKRVPRFNVDEPQTRESMDKFEALAKELNAKIIIQHESSDIEQLPKLPKYLD